MIQDPVATVLTKPYTRRLTPDVDGGYTATVQEFPGCFAEGETAEEALTNLNAAAKSWIEVSLAHGREIREPISFDGCSGKIALRIPRGLHQQIAELAELEDCSLNLLLTAAISEYVGKMDVIKKVTKAITDSIPALKYVHMVSGRDWNLASPIHGDTVIPRGAPGTYLPNIIPAGHLVPSGQVRHG